MSHKTLALKWRPRKFHEIIGQPHITRSFQNVIVRKRVGAAYLLTGTRGIGKTSLARIFAKAMCCQQPTEDGNPCCSCSHCNGIDNDSFLDVLEIDGASNNSVENIRQLIENVKYVPTKATKKIYIIDEVHMLSISAFNALLKTLEEPPEHVVFVMATTEIDKLPDTVVSRCQRFDFKQIPLELLATHIKSIASSEEITFENDILVERICAQGKGSVRDTLSVLEQLFSFTSSNNITEDDVYSILGLANSQTVGLLVTNIITGNVKQCSKIYRSLIRENIEISSLVTSILDHLFLIIEDFSEPEKLAKAKLLDLDLRNQISLEEIFWVYDSLAQDSTWVLKSIDPTKITEIAIQKIALRRTLLGSSALKIDTAGNSHAQLDTPSISSACSANESDAKSHNDSVIEECIIEESIVEESPLVDVTAIDTDAHSSITEIEVKEEVIQEKPEQLPSWDHFLTNLRKKSITMASNLEQGNLTKPAEEIEGILHISLGFPTSAKVFLEYLQDSAIFQRLKNEVTMFYGYTDETTVITLIDVDNTKKSEINFQSKVEIYQKQEDNIVKQKEEEFGNIENVLIAQKVFNSKIDKIIVKMEGH